MGKSERQIQRHIAEMEEAGLIQRIGRTSPGKRKTSNEYDLSRLVNKMKELEPEFHQGETGSQSTEQGPVTAQA